MVSREQLMTEGLRAYEVGRLKRATRVGLVLVPVTLLCLVESRGREACVCVAVALLGGCTWLRWRSRRGFEVVATGLQAGGVPLLAGLAFDRFDVRCGVDEASAFCSVFGVLVGALAGVFIAGQGRDWGGRFGSVLTAGAVAALAAALGCVRLGVIGVASVFGGIALGVALTAAVRRRR